MVNNYVVSKHVFSLYKLILTGLLTFIIGLWLVPDARAQTTIAGSCYDNGTGSNATDDVITFTRTNVSGLSGNMYTSNTFGTLSPDYVAYYLDGSGTEVGLNGGSSLPSGTVTFRIRRVSGSLGTSGPSPTYPAQVFMRLTNFGSNNPTFIINNSGQTCSVPPPCGITFSNIDVGTCNATSNSFALSFKLSWVTAPANQTINVTLSSGETVVIVPSTTDGSTTVSFPNLNSDGSTRTATAQFTGGGGCSATLNTIASPAQCYVPLCTAGPGKMGGKAYQDNNLSGTYNVGEPGASGVVVRIFNASNTVVASTTTNLSGEWQVTGLTDGQPYRIEFMAGSSIYTPATFNVSGNTTSTQFATPNTCNINYGVIDPGQVCDLNGLRVFIPCYVNGTRANTEPTLVAFDYGGTGNKQVLANSSQTGTLWGEAFSRQTKTLYVSSVYRRHSQVGPQGVGAIYKVDYSNPAAPVFSHYMNVANAGTDPRAGGVGDLPAGGANNSPSNDAVAFNAVGKIGLGDIDITEDGTRMFVTNLNTRSVVEINIATQTEIASYPLPTNVCSNAGDIRPWGLKVYQNKVYVGVVCSGETSGSTPTGFIYTLSGTSGSLSYSQVASINLGYQKPKSFDQACYTPAVNTTFKPWTSVWPVTNETTGATLTGTSYCANPYGTGEGYVSYEQPIIADIEFDQDGSLILGILDRFGLQSGFLNYGTTGSKAYVGIGGGDVLRLCNVNGTLVQAGQAGCPFPNGTIEYYTGDFYVAPGAAAGHQETALGGLLYIPGQNDVAVVSYDPVDGGSFNAGGVRWMDNTSGEFVRGFEVFTNSGAAPGTFAKSAGLGDIEANCAVSGQQLGNRVWEDTNSNGIQDAGESPIQGLFVSLYSSTGTFLGTTTTDANGQYAFTVNNNTSYRVVFGTNNTTSQYNTTTNSLVIGGVTRYLTTSNTGTGTQPDLNDSDATLLTSANATINGLPSLTVTMGLAGESNHTLDAGFFTVTAGLGDFVWEDLNRNGQQDPGEPGIEGVTVTLLSSNTVVTTMVTSTSGLYRFNNLSPTVPYSVSFSAPAGYSATLQNTGVGTSDSDGNPATGLTGTYSLTANEYNPTVDMGYFRPASLGDYVFIDTNKDGIQDAGDTPIASVTATLFTNGVASATTVTDASGAYSFTGLTPGTSLSYSVGFSTPAGYTTTTPNAPGSTTANDSDLLATGKTASITLVSGEHNPTLDAGFYPVPAISISITSAPVCNSVTNNYTATATVSLTNASAGTLTITDNGTTVGVISVTAGQTTASLSVTGISDAASHTVIATLTGGTSASVVYTAPVACTVCSTSITTASLPDGEVNTPYIQTITATGGTTPYTYSVLGTLPAGLNLVASTGVISGTPTTAATTSFTVKVTDAKSCTDVAAFSITIAALPVCSLTATATPGTCNSATNQYDVTGTVSLTNNTAGGVATITDGSQSTTVTVAASATSVAYSLSGLTSGTGSHTVVVSLPSCGTATAIYSAPASCTVAPCGLALTVTPGLCLSATNTYVLSGSLVATNVPTSGTLTISSGSFADRTIAIPAGNAGGPLSYSGLISDGQTYTVTASFSDSACSPVSQTYTAPASCSVAPVCAMSAVASAGLCATATNTYSASVAIALTNAPAGTITVSLPGSAPITQVLAANTSSFTAVFSGLISDGASQTATISLPGCGSTTTIFTAPVSCSVAPVCSISAVVTAGICQSATNTFSTTAVVTLTNPTVGVLTITDGPASQTFATTAVNTATFTAVFAGITSDGTSHTITAALPSCGTLDKAYTAPTSCSVAPVCSLSATVTAGLCASVTNTYSSTAVIVLTNPTAGTLTITDGPQSITFATTAGSSATFTAGFTGLVSDGSVHTIQATLPGCSATSTTYTAPASCSVAPVCSLSVSVSVGTCATATNTYSATAIITALSPPAGASLSVITDGRTLTFSTTAISQNTFVATFNGLTSDGANHLMEVGLPDCGTTSTTYTAPISCSVAPICSLSALVSTGQCSTATNTFSNTVTVAMTNPSAGTLTVSDGVRSVTIAVPATTGTVTVPTVFNGLVSDGSLHTVTVSLPGCSSLTTTYSAPASCTSGAPAYAIAKTVDLSRVAKGGIVTYTVSLTNTGNATGTNLVITDQLSTTAVTFVGSATASTGTFAPGINAGSWTIPSLAAGQVATLSLKVQLNQEGITYNKVTAPDGTTVSVCTSVPYKVCASEAFLFNLAVAAGQASYQWSKDGQPIAGATTNTLAVTAVGEYSVSSVGSGNCPDGSCCPFIIETYGPLPSLTAVAVSASCVNGVPGNDASITLVGNSTNAVSYNITKGSSFTANTPLFATGQSLSSVVGGTLLANQSNPTLAPGQIYTIRVYTVDGCFADTTVTIPPALCNCPAPVCIPVSVKRIR